MLEDCGDVKGHICLRPADGDLKSILVNEDFWFRGPSWSPDGGQIVVSASDRGDPYGQGASWASGDLYRLDTACLGQPQTCRDSLHPVTAGTGDNDIHPAWSPDGEWIAFHRNGDLAVVRPDGSTSTNYNFDTAERCVIEPAWSPDSRQIVFFSVVGGCDKQPPFDLEVRVVGLDHEGDRAIWRERVVDYPWGLAWSPDGGAVAARVRLENRDQWLLISLADGAVNEMPNEPIWWLPEHWPPWGGAEPTTQPSAAEPPQDPWGVVHLPPGQPIVIGLATALSGPVAEIGEGVRNAAQLAADQAAEIHGHPIQLMIGDSACNPDDGLAVARDFAATPEVVGVVGHLCSIASMSASSVYQEAHIVMISPASTAVGLTHQGFEVVHRTVVHDALQGSRAAEYAREGLGVQRAAVVNSGSQFEQAAVGFQERFSSMGGEVAYFQTLPGDTDDFAPALAEIQAAGVQAVYYAGNSANFVRQTREMLGDLTLIVIESAVVNNEFRAGAGDALEGTIAIAHAFDPESPIARPFVQAFMSRYDYRPSAYMGNAYDAVNLLLAAVEGVAVVAEGGELFIGRQALAERVRNTHDFPGVSGPITFDENGDRTSTGLGVFLFHDGAWMRAP